MSPVISSAARVLEHGADNPDPRPGPYYVSVTRDRRYALALGPFETHAGALEWVDAVRRLAHELEPRTWFDGFGTCRLDDVDAADAPAGRLNDRAELEGWRP